jgi:hypothetical protein
MGHAENEGYGKIIQYDVEKWEKVLVAGDNHKWFQKKRKMEREGAGKGRCNWGAEGVKNE